MPAVDGDETQAKVAALLSCAAELVHQSGRHAPSDRAHDPALHAAIVRLQRVAGSFEATPSDPRPPLPVREPCAPVRDPYRDLGDRGEWVEAGR